jgi:hypothetical protein
VSKIDNTHLFTSGTPFVFTGHHNENWHARVCTTVVEVSSATGPRRVVGVAPLIEDYIFFLGFQNHERHIHSAASGIQTRSCVVLLVKIVLTLQYSIF